MSRHAYISICIMTYIIRVGNNGIEKHNTFNLAPKLHCSLNVFFFPREQVGLFFLIIECAYMILALKFNITGYETLVLRLVMTVCLDQVSETFPK